MNSTLSIYECRFSGGIPRGGRDIQTLMQKNFVWIFYTHRWGRGGYRPSFVSSHLEKLSLFLYNVMWYALINFCNLPKCQIIKFLILKDSCPMWNSVRLEFNPWNNHRHQRTYILGTKTTSKLWRPSRLTQFQKKWNSLFEKKTTRLFY